MNRRFRWPVLWPVVFLFILLGGIYLYPNTEVPVTRREMHGENICAPEEADVKEPDAIGTGNIEQAEAVGDSGHTDGTEQTDGTGQTDSEEQTGNTGQADAAEQTDGAEQAGNTEQADAAEQTDGTGQADAAEQTDSAEQTDGTEQTEVAEQTELSEADAYGEIVDELDLSELEQALAQQGIETPVSVSEMVQALVNGDTSEFASMAGRVISGVLTGKLVENKNLMLELIGIVLVGSVFVNLSNSFAGGLVGENGFYITYMLMTSLLLTSFSTALIVTRDALEAVLTAVRLLVPVFLAVLRFAGQTTSAAGTYSLILLGIWLIQAVIVRVVLPLIEFYVILSMVNRLQREDSFSKLCELVHSLIRWILRTIIAVVIGGSVIKGLLEPQMDQLGKTAANRVLSALPGGAASVLAGTYLACGMVIKNSIGIAGILILSFLCLVPLAQMFLIMVTVRVTSALIQPLGDKRFIDGTMALSQGIALLMQTLAYALCMFVIVLAIMAAATNGGV